MSKECFRIKSFNPRDEARIDLCNDIIEDYSGQGLRMTLRQLYYQLVTKNAITNEEKSYKNLGKLVSDARLAGLMDWSAIEDRGRMPDVPSDWSSIASLAEAACRGFRLPRWEGQEYYAELWVEKQALAGVLEPLASKFHVTLMVNKGYSSQSAMYSASRRFLYECNDGERKPMLFYLGDHDPSGEDMVRDVRERLEMFGVEDIVVDKLALTMTQIKKYNPPPNPAKVTDSRAAAYIAEHGDSSWEVDALPPNVLARIISSAFEEIIDKDAMDAIIAREEKGKTALRKAAAKIEV